MTDKTTEPVLSAAAVRVAYMRRAKIRRNSPLPGRYYRLRITPDMVGMSIAGAIDLLNKREHYRKPHYRPTQK